MKILLSLALFLGLGACTHENPEDVLALRVRSDAVTECVEYLLKFRGCIIAMQNEAENVSPGQLDRMLKKYKNHVTLVNDSTAKASSSENAAMKKLCSDFNFKGRDIMNPAGCDF